MLRAEIGYSPTTASPTAVEDAATEQAGAQETTILPSEVPPPSTEPVVIYPQPAFSLHQPELGTTNTGIQKPFSCDFCGRRFTRNTTRRHHERVAHADLPDSQNQPEPENTSNPAAISTQPTLSQHQPELETNPTANPTATLDTEKPFGCDFCGSRFTRNTSKRRHERCSHADLLNLRNRPRPGNPSAANPAAEKPYSCDHCSVRFRERRSKQHHERVAHPEVESGAQQPAKEERFSCDYCSKDFKALYNKKRHERENHLAVRSFVCSVCRKIYNRSDALKTHMSMAHGISLPKGPLPRPSTSTMSPYQPLPLPLPLPQVEQDQQTQQQEEQDQQEDQEDASLEQRGEEDLENPRKRSRDGQEGSGDELSKRLRLQSRRSSSP
ncbi:uncharacterized protein J3D65DRAFT_622783 [Phyllosticta citribraziliensis]|uniref:C2H2-type domain-containing protein n=1 Tax=Phyllosticta citribraziliensis TaxID=989973 RepID=A0ABR1LU30_9PEZI